MLADQLQQHGFQIDFLDPPKIPIKNLKNPSFVITSTLCGILKRNYDIVHAFNVPSAFAMRSVRTKKRVLSVHGVFSDQVNVIHSGVLANISAIMEKRAFKWADRLTTDSFATKKLYKEKLGMDFTYLPSPIDTFKFKSLPPTEKKENQVVYIGRDSFEKGIDLIKKIEPQINGNVVYCTNLSWEDTMTTLKQSQLLVVPSRIESLPTVVKEAFYLKIPVVATDVGGTSELVKDGYTGILVPSDNKDQLLEAVNALLADKNKSSKMVENAYDFVLHNMTWEAILPKYVEFYNSLIQSM